MNEIEKLEREIRELTVKRHALGEQHKALMEGISQHTHDMGGKMLAGKSAANDIESIARDRIEAEGLLSAMLQADSRLSELTSDLQGLKRDAVSAEVNALQEKITSIADEITGDLKAILEKAAQGIELQDKINRLGTANYELFAGLPDIRNWQQFRPAAHCNRARANVDKILLDIKVNTNRSGSPYLT